MDNTPLSEIEARRHQQQIEELRRMSAALHQAERSVLALQILGGLTETDVQWMVHGQILNVESASGIDLTFHIIRPDHD